MEDRKNRDLITTTAVVAVFGQKVSCRAKRGPLVAETCPWSGLLIRFHRHKFSSVSVRESMKTCLKKKWLLYIVTGHRLSGASEDKKKTDPCCSNLSCT